MYAYLTFVTSPKIQWLVDFYSEFLDVAPVAKLPQEHVEYRTHLVDVVIKQTTAGLDASAQREHRSCLLSFALAIEHMHKNENPLTREAGPRPGRQDSILPYLYLAMAHRLADPAHRSQREARINQIISSHHITEAARTPTAAQLNHLRDLATMVPDASLDLCVQGLVSGLEMWLDSEPPGKPVVDVSKIAPDSKLGRVMRDLARELDSTGNRSREGSFRLSVVLWEHYFFVPVAARAQWMAMLRDLVARRAGQALTPTVDQITKLGMEACALQASIAAVLDRALSTPASGPALIELIEAETDAECHSARAAYAARQDAIWRASLDATRRGVAFGPVGDDLNALALKTMDQLVASQDYRIPPPKPTPTTPATTTQPLALAASTNDPMPHAWSVARLVRWIEGPVVEKAPRRLDRAALARGVTVGKATRTPQTPRAAGQEVAAAGEEAMSDGEVTSLVSDALADTARFFLGDLDDMVTRIRVQGLIVPPGADIHTMHDRLEAVCQGRLADDDARHALFEAEAFTQTLRRSVQTAHAEQQLRQRFDAALRQALATEAIALGRRQGGRIACPLQQRDWSWVADAYHGAWWPTTRQLDADGTPYPLRPDQALALYVTGSSQSGALFDVSVHLWQRRPGRLSGPGQASVPWTAMNTDDWFDTYITCAVLHVQSAG